MGNVNIGLSDVIKSYSFKTIGFAHYLKWCQ